MDKDDIQKLILESNVLITTETNSYQVWMPENIEKFADLVAKAEREACAKLCDEYIDSASDHESGTASSIQEAIRARGQ
jgi:hypothetical protein